MRLVLGTLATCASAILAVFGAPVTAALFLVAALLYARGRWITALLPLLPSPVTAVIEYPLRIEPLAARHAAGGPDALGRRDRASVWLLHLGMGLAGAPMFPEAASETLRLVVPGPVVRVIRSSFPGGATPVRQAIGRWEEALRKAEDDAVLFRPRRLVIGRTELRHALALDPVTLSGSAVRDGARWRLEVLAAVPIDYPPKSALPLFSTPAGPVRIHEGLFDALEQRGWLFPYSAEYRWTEWIDDPS